MILLPTHLYFSQEIKRRHNKFLTKKNKKNNKINGRKYIQVCRKYKILTMQKILINLKKIF